MPSNLRPPSAASAFPELCCCFSSNDDERWCSCARLGGLRKERLQLERDMKQRSRDDHYYCRQNDAEDGGDRGASACAKHLHPVTMLHIRQADCCEPRPTIWEIAAVGLILLVLAFGSARLHFASTTPPDKDPEGKDMELVWPISPYLSFCFGRL